MKLHVLGLLYISLLTGCGLGTAGVVAASDSSSSSSNAKTVGSEPEVRDEDYEMERALASPAAIHFALTDEEGDPADVVIEFSQDGANFDPITLALGSASLNQVPSNQGYEVLWDFSTDLPNGEGYTGNLTIRLTVVGGISPENVTEIEVGNDVPAFTPPTFAPEISGIVPVRFSVEDTEADPIEIKIEYQIDGDTNWFLARDAELSDPLDTGEAFAVDTDADGEEEVFFWDTAFTTAYEDSDGDEVVTEGNDTGVLAAKEAAVRLRFTLREAFSQTESNQTLELVEDPPFVIDNNAEPIAVLDSGPLVTNPDQRRGLPVPFSVIDAEGDEVEVIFQWRRADENFHTLDEDEIDEILADPVLRRQKQICTPYPRYARGRVVLDNETVRLPELAVGESWILASGIEGKTLDLLRPANVFQAVPNHELSGPVAAIPVGDGLTAQVLEGGSHREGGLGGGTWRLREIELATGDLIREVAAGAGGAPTAMAYERGGEKAVLIALNLGGLWRLERIDLDSGKATTVYTSHGDPRGPVRGFASIGTHAAAVTADDCLVLVDYSDAARPHTTTLLYGLATPHGVAADPWEEGHIFVAMRDGVLSVNTDTSAVRSTVTKETGSLSNLSSIALGRPGARLFMVTRSFSGMQQVMGLNLAGRGGNEPFAIGAPFPGAETTLASGPNGLLLIVSPTESRLYAAGGIEQRRVVQSYDPVTHSISVSDAFSPLPQSDQEWSIRIEELPRIPANDQGAASVFVWDSRNIEQGLVHLRAIPRDSEVGIPAQSTTAKEVITDLDVTPIRLGRDGDEPQHVIATDVDADGDLDLVSANRGRNQVAVLYQFAPGEFDSAHTDELLSTGRPVSVAAADLDGNGKIDLVSANENRAELKVFMQTDGGFEPAIALAEAASTQAVEVGDIDGDGRPDLVSANADDIGIYLQPPGGFQADSLPDIEIRIPGLTENVEALEIADVDRDGQLDLIIGSTNSGAYDDLAVLFQTQPEGFNSDLRLGNARFQDWRSVETADLNGDGLLDLLAKGSGLPGGGLPGGGVVVGFLQPLHGFEHNVLPDIRLSVGTGPGSCTAADVNHDGRLDIVSADLVSRRLNIFLQAPSGSFETLFFVLQPSGMPAWVEAADLNGDGRIDLVVATNDLVIFLHEGPGRFQSPPTVVRRGPDLANLRTVVPADIAGDGMLDLVTANAPSVGNVGPGVGVYSQVSPGDFPSEPIVLDEGNPSFPWDVVAVDLDGDLDLDLVQADGDGQGANKLVLYDQISPQIFDAPRSLFGSDMREPVSIAAGDLNRDGVFDLVSANNLSHNLSVFFNSGTGEFPEEIVLGGIDVTESVYSVVVSDVDSDGGLDVVCASHFGADQPDGQISVFLQGQPGQFDQSRVIGGQGKTGDATSVVAADLDGDGHVDIVSGNGYDAGEGDTLSIFFGVGEGAFLEDPLVLPFPGIVQLLPGVFTNGDPSPRYMTAADIDIDGDLDLITANSQAQSVTVFFQTAPRNFDPVPLELGGPGLTDDAYAVTVSDIDGDGEPDIVCGNFDGMTIFWGGR